MREENATNKKRKLKILLSFQGYCGKFPIRTQIWSPPLVGRVMPRSSTQSSVGASGKRTYGPGVRAPRTRICPTPDTRRTICRHHWLCCPFSPPLPPYYWMLMCKLQGSASSQAAVRAPISRKHRKTQDPSLQLLPSSLEAASLSRVIPPQTSQHLGVRHQFVKRAPGWLGFEAGK